MEKDERFWLATALMSLYHADEALAGAAVRPPARASRACARQMVSRWEDALAGPLDLFFEVNLPSPARYRAWLRDHLGERAPDPLPQKARRKRRGRGWKERRGPTPCCSLPIPA